MKKIVLPTVVLAVLGAAAPAVAADFGARPSEQAVPIYNWTGFYVGGHIGGAFSSDNDFSGLAIGNNSNGRFLGGLQVGADWQLSPTWVIGTEGQISWLSGNVEAIFPAGFVYTNNQRALGSVTARIGYTWGPGLIFLKGGYARSDNNETVTLGGIPVAFATVGDHSNGYTVGAGVEYMFAPNWSAKAEYQYYNFGDASFSAPAGLPFGRFTTDDHTLKAGVNYRFNWTGPVVAHY